MWELSGDKVIVTNNEDLKRIMDGRLREEVEISEEQFGFMPGRGTTNAVFILRQMAEKYREKKRDMHMTFIDLEKAYDRIPRQELWRCLREKLVPEKYVRLIQEMYRDARTSVKSAVGNTESFGVKVGLHQGSTLSPFLFNIVFDILTKEVRRGIPHNIIYADDVVLCGETREGVEMILEEWRRALESRGLRISRTKTEYMRCSHQVQGQQRGIRLGGEDIKTVGCFKYLGSTMVVDGGEELEITRRIQAGWKNWRDVSGVLCDRRMPVKLKGKVYKTVVRPAMLYGMEVTPIKKVNEKRMDVAEMKMLRWMTGVTRKDRIRNTRIRGTVKVTEISKKAQEARLRWYGHILRREAESVERVVMDMEVQGSRGRGRPKTRWKDCIAKDLRERGLDVDAAQDRTHWRQLIKNSDPI